MEQWYNIELQTPVLSQPKSYHAIELLKWCWVIQIEIFVLIDDPTKLQLKNGPFGSVHYRPDGFPETGGRGGSNQGKFRNQKIDHLTRGVTSIVFYCTVWVLRKVRWQVHADNVSDFPSCGATIDILAARQNLHRGL